MTENTIVQTWLTQEAHDRLQAEYEERRAWDDLLKQHQESQERFEKASSRCRAGRPWTRRTRWRSFALIDEASGYPARAG